MFLFLAPLLVGFSANLASAFTATFSRWWGERRGSAVSFVLRNILGIPVWAGGFLLATRAPAPLLFGSTAVTIALGWLLIAAGGALILVALATIRFRAVKPSTRDTLVRSGLYRHVRHPIHSGTFLEFAGLLLLMPTPCMALACGLGAVWILVQTRFEEIDLLQRLPAYGETMRAVPRFLPRLRIPQRPGPAGR